MAEDREEATSATGAGSGAAGVAYTVQDAATTGATDLRLQRRCLAAVPDGVSCLAGLRELDLSDNPRLAAVAGTQLPPGLTALRLTGCGLVAPPACGGVAGRGLRRVYLAGNCIAGGLAPLLALPQLEHLGLAYNRISRLEDPPRSCPLVSLDLSHNDLCTLAPVLAAAAALPRLRALWLRGNPAALAPGYTAAAVAALPALAWLEGRKLDVLSGGSGGGAAGSAAAGDGSRPGSSLLSRDGRRPGSECAASAGPQSPEAAAAEVAARAAVAEALRGGGTWLLVRLTCLDLDPTFLAGAFAAAAEGRGCGSGSASGGTGAVGAQAAACCGSGGGDGAGLVEAGRRASYTYASAAGRWASTAGGTERPAEEGAPPAEGTAQPQLQFYLQLSTHEGVEITSLAVSLPGCGAVVDDGASATVAPSLPPGDPKKAPPRPGGGPGSGTATRPPLGGRVSAAAGGGGTAAGAAGGRAKGWLAAAERLSVQELRPAQVPAGELHACLWLSPTVEARDWMRDGAEVALWLVTRRPADPGATARLPRALGVPLQAGAMASDDSADGGPGSTARAQGCGVPARSMAPAPPVSAHGVPHGIKGGRGAGPGSAPSAAHQGGTKGGIPVAAPAPAAAPAAMAAAAAAVPEAAEGGSGEAHQRLPCELKRSWLRVGSCRLPTDRLLDTGDRRDGTRGGGALKQRATLLPPPPLFDGRGVRLALKEAARRAALAPVGAFQCFLELHAAAAAPGGRPGTGAGGARPR